MLAPGARLGLVLPAAVLTGVLLVRRRPWGFVLGAYFLVKFTTLGLAIMSMSVFMVADGQPSISAWLLNNGSQKLGRLHPST